MSKAIFVKLWLFVAGILDLISTIWGWAAMQHMLCNAERSIWPSTPALLSLLLPSILFWALGSQFVHKVPAFPSFLCQPQSPVCSKYDLGNGLNVWLKYVVLTDTLFLCNSFTRTRQTDLKMSDGGTACLPFHPGTGTLLKSTITLEWWDLHQYRWSSATSWRSQGFSPVCSITPCHDYSVPASVTFSISQSPHQGLRAG